MRLDQVNLVVRDVAASTAFWERLGITFEPTRDGWDRHHRTGHGDGGADVDLDSPAFAASWNGGSTGSGVVLGVRVESRERVDELFAELVAAGHPAQQEPYDAFFGARFAVLTDPDGNAVALMSPPDRALGSAPPDPSTFDA